MCKFVCTFIGLSLILISGCRKNDTNVILVEEQNFNFKSDNEGWTAGFADYPNDPDVENFYELHYSHSTLPSPLDNSEGALKQSGINHSDDLFMFIKKKISGLEPDKTCSVEIEIEIASNAPDNRVGVGGSPGEGVYIKAGASSVEPVKVLDTSDNYFRMNIDKGDQSLEGADMQNIGNFANGTELDIYKLKTLKTTSPVEVKSNSNGEIWLIIGTDSGFEYTTTIYYNSVKATFK
jgi:hypothetical protein